MIAFMVLCSSCDKYKNFTGSVTVIGTLQLSDSTVSMLPVPVPGQTVYVNTGGDTGTYEYQTTTDSLGTFVIPALKHGITVTLFTRFSKNGMAYYGVLAFTTGAAAPVVLTVYPKYTNGIGLGFMDAFGSYVANLPFRLYTSRTAALVDSTREASFSLRTNAAGRDRKSTV